MEIICYCGEQASIITKNILVEENEKCYECEQLIISKCMRPLESSQFYNTRKRPCKFYQEKIIKKFQNNKIQKEVVSNNNKNKNIIYYRNELYKLLNNYSNLIHNSFNYISKLNYYLYLFNFEQHFPNKETCEELINRVYNNVPKKNIKMLIYKDLYDPSLQINEDESDNLFNEIFNIKSNNYFDWTKNLYIKKTLKMKKVVKNTKIKKSKKNHLAENLESLKIIDIDSFNEYNECNEDEDDNEDDDDEDKDSNYDDDGEESEDHKNIDKDNNFDMEVEPNDDYDDNDNISDYEDFSD